MQIKEHRFVICHSMDDKNATKIRKSAELRKSRKRNGERERIDGEFLRTRIKD